MIRVRVEPDHISLHGREIHLLVTVKRGTFRVVVGPLQSSWPMTTTSYWVRTLKGRALGEFAHPGASKSLSERYLKSAVNRVLDEWQANAATKPQSDAALLKGVLPP